MVGKVDLFQKQGDPEIIHTSYPSGKQRRTTPSVPHSPETALLWLPALDQDCPVFSVTGSTWTNIFEVYIQFEFLSPADHHLLVLVLLPCRIWAGKKKGGANVCYSGFCFRRPQTKQPFQGISIPGSNYRLAGRRVISQGQTSTKGRESSS